MANQTAVTRAQGTTQLVEAVQEAVKFVAHMANIHHNRI